MQIAILISTFILKILLILLEFIERQESKIAK